MTSPESADDLAARLSAADEIHAQAARVDPNGFMEFVLRDEFTGNPIQQAPIHESWQRLMTRHKRLLVWSHVESGKTSQFSIGRTLWEIGKNPNVRVAIISNTHEQASKIVRSIARYVEQSAEMRVVFPDVRKSEPWTSHHLFVHRPTVSKDPTVQACGVHGNILGARIDRLILDDVLDYENCRTEGLRSDLWNWYHSTLAGRLTKEATVHVVGTAFHPGDLLHRLATVPGWQAFRYPIVDTETGRSRWPDRWPDERIAQRRQELGPLEFARQMLCVARDDTEARFKREWIERCLERGRGKEMQVNGIEKVPPGCRTYTGVDLAVSRKESAGKTVLFTLMIHPDGTREVLNIESGRWSGQEIIDRIVDNHRRFQSVVIVESNVAQSFIVQFTHGSSDVPVRPFTTTGKNKYSVEFGVESIAAEMAAAKWIIPCGEGGDLHPEVMDWITQMLYYDPKSHTGDSLMACWIAREGSRQGDRKVEFGRLDLTSR